MELIFDPRYEICKFDHEAAEAAAFEKLRLKILKAKASYNVNAIGVPDAFGNGGYCIHREENVWLVYHSERGLRSDVAIFTSPSSAANYFYWRLVATPIESEDLSE